MTRLLEEFRQLLYALKRVIDVADDPVARPCWIEADEAVASPKSALMDY